MRSMGTITTIETRHFQRIALGTALLAAAALALGAAATPVDAACGAAQCTHHARVLHAPPTVLDSRNLIGAPVEAYLHFDDGVPDSAHRLQFGPAYA